MLEHPPQLPDLVMWLFQIPETKKFP